MPPIGKKPDEPLNAYQIDLVKSASYQFVVAGCISVDLCQRLAEMHIDFRDILDGAMTNESFNPKIH